MAHRPDSLVIRTRVDTRTTAQKDIFITALSKLLNVSVACSVTGLTRSRVYGWRNEDPEFAERWDDAIALAEGSLESATYLKLAEMLQDARKRISPAEARLIEMYLAGAFPEKYRQRTIEIDNTQLSITIDWASIPQEILERFNAGQLTLQDVYDWSLQYKKQESPDPSPD